MNTAEVEFGFVFQKGVYLCMYKVLQLKSGRRIDFKLRSVSLKKSMSPYKIALNILASLNSSMQINFNS